MTRLRRPVSGRLPARLRRPALRAAALALPLLLVSWLPAIASAAPTDDLPGHTSTFTIVDGILVFAVVPIGVSLLVALLVMRPGTAPKAQRYRPGRDWDAPPSWTGLQPAPADVPGRSLPAGQEAQPVMDGAGDHTHHDSPPDPGQAGTARARKPGRPASGSGGARGSW